MINKQYVMSTQVAGRKYDVYRDCGQTMKWAVRDDGEERVIYKGGAHFSTDLATRKAIMYAFQTGTFRK